VIGYRYSLDVNVTITSSPVGTLAQLESRLYASV